MRVFDRYRLPGSFALLAVVPLVAACGDDSSGPAGSANVSVSFSVPAPGLRAPSVIQASLVPVRDNAGNTLDLTLAQIVVAEVELERTDDAEDCDASGRRNPCNEFEAGPVLVSLNANGGLSTLFTDPIPAGSYDELEIEIEKPDEDDAATRAFRTANPTFANASVRLTGTFNGQPFDVFVDVEAELELRLNPPLVVSGKEASNITIEIDVSKFFVGTNGNFIDPRTLSSNSSARDRVRSNIRAAFRAFEDDDKNGR